MYKQIQQQSAQEKFNNAVAKLQDLIGNLVAGPLGRLIDGFANIASSATTLYSIMGALAGLSFVKLVGGLAAAAVQSGILAAGTITATQALTFGVSAIAIGAAIGALMGVFNNATNEASSKSQQVKDGVAPSSKGPFTITDAYGATAVTTAGDGVVVSPNINSTTITKPTQQSINLSPITEAINTLNSRIDALVSRPVPTPQFALHVDGRQLGTVVGNQMETGTAQNMTTSYKVA